MIITEMTFRRMTGTVYHLDDIRENRNTRAQLKLMSVVV